MAPNDDRLRNLFGKKNDPAPELPPDDPVELETAEGSNRVGAKPQLSVTFVDAEGNPLRPSLLLLPTRGGSDSHRGGDRTDEQHRRVGDACCQAVWHS